MWFYPILLILVLLGLVGGIFLGGVYTLVLVPLVVVAIVSTVGYAIWTRSQASAGSDSDAAGAPGEPLPHRRQRAPRRVTTTPDRLVEGRRQQQQVSE